MNSTLYRPVQFDWIDQWIDQALASNAKPIRTDVDIIHREDKIELEFELPGLSRNDVQISITDRTLHIKAEKKRLETNNNQWFLRERRFGTIERSFRLSEDLETEGIHAKMENGVLYLQIPRRHKVSQQIDIQ